MKKTVLKGFIFLIFPLVSCATVGSINKNYHKINYADGINQEEAILIAKHELIQTDKKYTYRVLSPKVNVCECVAKSDKEKKIIAWRVQFVEKPRSFLVNNVIMTEMQYLINKETGQVLGFNEYASHGAFEFFMNVIYAIGSESKMQCSDIEEYAKAH